MEKASKAISFVFHPLLMPSLGLLVLFNSGTYLSYLPPEIKQWMFIIIFLSTCVLPLGLIPFMIYRNLLKDVYMQKRQERFLPLVVSLILYAFCFYLIRRIEIPRFYSAFILSSTLTVLTTLLITIGLRISIHMAGIGGLIALIGYLSFSMNVNLQFYLIVSVLLAGFLGTSRLLLEAHTPAEVYTGFLAGFGTVLISFMLY